MGSYDNFPISEAHRAALEARDTFYRDGPGKRPKVPDEVAAAAPSLGECQSSYALADLCYGFGTDAFGGGSGDGEFWMTLGAEFTQAGHACINAIIHRNPFE